MWLQLTAYVEGARWVSWLSMAEGARGLQSVLRMKEHHRVLAPAGGTQPITAVTECATDAHTL